MKRSSQIWVLTLALASACALTAIPVSTAHAVTMDFETHDELIRRLEDTHSSMSKNAKEMNPVIFRLAGLYADRARLKNLSEVEKNCNNCLKSKEDRSLAIAYFQQSLSSHDKEKQGEILVQIAHLSNLNNKNETADKIFKDIVKNRKKYSSRVVALAHLNLAEAQFRKANYKSALALYDQALKSDLPDPGFANHRRAWCFVNLGQDQKGIDTLARLLSDPNQIQEASFHEDVSFDYATILARSRVTQKEINNLLAVSPENRRKANLKVLSEETDRLGKKSATYLVWKAYSQEPGFTKVEQVESQIRLAQIQFDLGHKEIARQEYKTAIALWKDLGCKDESQCADIKARYKSFVTSWNKVQKASPDRQLLTAYQDYLSLFTTDLEMTYWAAFTAKNLRDFEQGVKLFRRSAELAKEQKNDKLFEGSLIGEIEMAEGSKRIDLKEAAYTNYINMNPNGKEASDIRYQRALIWNSQKKYQEAFSEFHFLATTHSKIKADLKVKSADMALDNLAALKDHAALQVRSQEYIKYFPARRQEYLKIARTAVLNQVTFIMAQKNADESEAKAALKKLKEYPTEGATKDDLIKLYKNQIVLAQQTQDASAIESAARSMYSMKGLSQEENRFALTKLAWVSELKLDFKTAYNYNKKLSPKKTNAHEELKLAVLAELAGLNSSKHYDKYLKLEKNRTDRNIVIANMVKKSSRPWVEIKKHLKDLKKSPALLAEVALDSYGRSPSDREVKNLLRSTRIARFPEGQTLQRQFDIRDMNAFDRKIAKHRLNAANDRLLEKSLTARLNLLSSADKEVKKSIRSKDWSLQVASLAIVARENERLQNDLLALPVPRKLKGPQVAEYKSLIKAKAEVYRQKAENVSKDINNLFERDNVLAGMEKALSHSPRHVKKVLESEIRMMTKLVRGSAKSRLENLLKIKGESPSYQDLLIARNSVKEDPFSTKKLERLQQLEQQSGSNTMAGYLDARIVEIKKGAKL